MSTVMTKQRPPEGLVCLGDVFEEQAMTHEQLVAERLVLKSDIDSIEAQLRNAERKKKTDNTSADPRWSARANFALGQRRRRMSRLDSLIDAKVEESRREREEYLEACFVRVAIETLDKKVFDRIYQKAVALSREEAPQS
jgi:hypothetical protein